MRHTTNIAVAKARVAHHRNRHAAAKACGRTRRTTQARYALALDHLDRSEGGNPFPVCFATMVTQLA